MIKTPQPAVPLTLPMPQPQPEAPAPASVLQPFASWLFFFFLFEKKWEVQRELRPERGVKELLPSTKRMFSHLIFGRSREIGYWNVRSSWTPTSSSLLFLEFLTIYSPPIDGLKKFHTSPWSRRPGGGLEDLRSLSLNTLKTVLSQDDRVRGGRSCVTRVLT